MLIPLVASIALIAIALYPGQQNHGRPTVRDLEEALSRAPEESSDKYGDATCSDAGLSAHALFTSMEPRDVPDHLLLSVLIAGSTGTRNPNDVALDLMRRAEGDIANISHLDVVRDTPGMGPSGRARLIAASEFARRLEYRSQKPRKAILGADDAVNVLRPLVVGPVERLVAVYLDRRHKVLGTRILTTGNDGSTVVDARQIIRPALEMGATSFIIAHNHPSGDPTPSYQDKQVTKAVSEAAKVMGMRLLDHFTFGRRGEWRSMQELGMIP